MTRETRRRDAVAQAATDYVLEHGLVGLSLRPLAAALGTSDRMLLYHFEDKDDLVVTILRTTSDRSVDDLRGLPPPRDVRSAAPGVEAALQHRGEDPRSRRAAASGRRSREPCFRSASRARVLAHERPPCAQFAEEGQEPLP